MSPQQDMDRADTYDGDMQQDVKQVTDLLGFKFIGGGVADAARQISSAIGACLAEE